MPASGNSLVDANVWLALAVDAHMHHAPALKRWSDAFLAAFAKCLGLEVVTFDADFSSFTGLSVRLLTGQ